MIQFQLTIAEKDNEIQILKNRIDLLEKEKKSFIIKEEESTQLIIKLDTKLHNARSEIIEMKDLMEKYEKENDKKINELSECLNNISKLSESFQKENEELKLKLSSSINIDDTKKTCIDLLTKLKETLE